MTPVFVALTPLGFETARRAQAALGGEVHVLTSTQGNPPPLWGKVPAKRSEEVLTDTPHLVTFTDTAAHLRSLFSEGRPIVGICAAGILIRILAPLLSAKRDEPPVLAVSEDGAEIVPLLGGHQGANPLAGKLAGALGGHAAITTAGDRRFGVALDAPPKGWTLANLSDAKSVMAALIAGESARWEGECAWLSESGLPLAPDGVVRLIATTRSTSGDARTLVYHPRKLVLGIGCERNADSTEALSLVRTTLANAGLAPASVACVASIDLKADEHAVLETAHELGVPARFFPAAVLERETPRLKTPSETVYREVGAHGVAEAAALAAVGPSGSLIIAKTKSRRVTCAIAEARNILDPKTIGRARGRLAIVGIGPGSSEWLTPEARRLLAESDAAVGYSLYLDLAAPLIAGAERFDSVLGSEEERARLALSLAGEGRSVALVSSGDPGIYAMASLVFECLDRPPSDTSSHWETMKRVEIVVSPGLSAMQAAAARAGAPLGHDFCAISLSDLLTPWETIESRITAAAESDFVIAFYNPVSQRRRTQLSEAKTILLRHRPADTPVVLAHSLGRDGERVVTVTLSDLDPETIDMLTLVIVGASTTRQVTAGGRVWTYTPRGYDRKHDAPTIGMKQRSG